MQVKTEVLVYGVKESSGSIDGRAFSSTVFHCKVDIKENGVGRALGHVTRPFKLGDHKEFEKWLPLGTRLAEGPVLANATFDMEATKEDGTRLVLVAIEPIANQTRPALPRSAAPA